MRYDGSMMNYAQANELLSKGQRAAEAGRYAEAETHADQVLADYPADPQAQTLKAICRQSVSDFDGAITIYRSLAKAHPSSADIHNMIGQCEIGAGRADKAEEEFRTAERKNPENSFFPYNLGVVLERQSRKREAAEAYQRAIDISADHLYAQRGLAHILNDLNEHDRAEKAAHAALALDPNDPVALSVAAAADLRNGEPQAALDRIKADFKETRANPVEAAMIWGRIGDAREALGDFRGAAEAWGQANRGLRQLHAPEYEAHQGPYSITTAKRLRDFFKDAKPQQDEKFEPGPAPVFLVGFMRSGTTLLEQVLAAHPKIETSGEADTIRPFLEAASEGGDLAAIMTASPTRLKELGKAYWKHARPDAGAPKKGEIFVDKLPANLMWTGVLAHIFPNARFILSLRDPRDAVLSAWRQRFEVNPATYRMLQMTDAAEYYDASMAAFEAARAAHGDLTVHETRYENLVADLEKETRAVLEFIGADWDKAVLDYREQALAREITTPSAGQVVRPVYSESVDRWRNYEAALSPVRGLLDPWAEHWKYSG